EKSLEYLLTKPKDSKIIGVIAALGAKLDTISEKDKREQIIKIIEPYLDNSNPTIRLKAVNALSYFSDREAKELLQSKMALETNEFVLSKYKEVIKNK
ncbi:MAG: HEAT repeat domain-containing protein, partial [candidate division WOR-3 bacterium]